MSEKKLYKDVTVTKGRLPTATPTQRAYRGISTANNDNQKFGLYDVGLIKQDLINHFHISQGEKLENPTFGTIIWDVIHDPMTPDLEDAIKEDVMNIINNDDQTWENSVLMIAGYDNEFRTQTEELIPDLVKKGYFPERLYVDIFSEGGPHWGNTDSLIQILSLIHI